MNNIKAPVSMVKIPDDLPPLEYQPENLTAQRGGFFRSESEQQQLEQLNADLMRKTQLYFVENPSPAGRADRREIDSLVQRCKSPTRSRREAENAHKFEAISRFQQHLRDNKGVVPVKTSRCVVQEKALYSDNIGSFGGVDLETGEITGPNYYRSPIARISHREWSDEYRIRVQADINPSDPPPQQAGERTTKDLSSRGARNILESGAFVSAVRGGYTTFLTLTFDNDARSRIINGDTTIGSECSRFFDALNKMYQRGWSTDNQVLSSQHGFDCIGASEVIPPSRDKLDYLWVAECPKNKKGELNPHCHVLLRWSVEPYLFHDWASRIEKLWGYGFAKLERIKHADAASGYLLKALGYLTKGEKTDQGEINGNRYNISKAARAPKWELIGSFHAQNMAAIIGEVHEKWLRQDAPIKGEICSERQSLNKAVRDKAVLTAMKNHKAAKEVAKRIKVIESRIKSGYEKLKARPARSADYQITFKGADALSKFINWSTGARLWEGVEVTSQYIPNRIPSNLWVKGITSARRKFKYLIPKLEEAAASWSRWLSDTFWSVQPEKEQYLDDLLEYEKWISS